MQTKVFKLVSGPEVEITKYAAKDQRILTETNGKSYNDKLVDFMIGKVVRIGDCYIDQLTEKQKRDLFNEMLVVDKKQILTELRIFTNPDPIFSYIYKYVSNDQRQKEVVIDVDISDGFPARPFLMYDEAVIKKLIKGVTKRGEEYVNITALVKLRMEKDKLFNQSVIADAEDEDESEADNAFPLKVFSFTDYADVIRNKHIVTTLPDSGKKVMFTLLDGYGESIGANTDRKQLSSHTPFLMRRLKHFPEAEDKVPYNFTIRDIDKLSEPDIEYLRSLYRLLEGEIDTENMFEHPEADLKYTESEKHLVVDLVGQLSFFFRSQTV